MTKTAARSYSRSAVMALHSSAMKASSAAVVSMTKSLLKEAESSTARESDGLAFVLSGILEQALEAKAAIDKLDRSLQANKGNGDGTASRVK